MALYSHNPLTKVLVNACFVGVVVPSL